MTAPCWADEREAEGRAAHEDKAAELASTAMIASGRATAAAQARREMREEKEALEALKAAVEHEQSST